MKLKSEEYETLRKIVLDYELTEDFNILPKEVMERNVLVEKFLFVDYWRTPITVVKEYIENQGMK